MTRGRDIKEEERDEHYVEVASKVNFFFFFFCF